MSRSQFRLPSDSGRTVRKLFLSVFVVFTFAAYVIHERLTKPDSALYAASSLAAASAAGSPAAAQAAGSLGAPSPTDSAVPALSSGGTAGASSYKNGTFQGQPVDAYYGLVQVQVSIQGGAMKSVQFLQYPNDRRTSRQINSIAMPYLQQEAIQAQSANVDIISGATLTSQGFEMSLQSALQAARN